jgi:nitrite reductase/ring-hydroxylating ferredoxin subunit
VSAPRPTVRVDISGLAPGDTVMFLFERDDESLEGFVVRHKDAYFAYVNRCAHVTFSLDVGDGKVMDEKGQFILCSTHGARYLPESGECFMGPVVGRRLESMPLCVEAGAAIVTIPPCPAGWPAN